jgi:hypothetical protein
MTRRTKGRTRRTSGTALSPAPAGGRATEFDKDVYKRAAIERLQLANELHEQGTLYRERYVMACYVAGLAVECILLAYLAKTGLAREDRHDLRKLALRSGFWDAFADVPKRDRLSGVLQELATRWWANSHRYRSEGELRAFLKGRGLFRIDGIYVKGDLVEYCSRLAVNSANELVAAGVEKWKP